MGKQTKQLCKAIAECVRRGELTKSQGKTLIGQAKSGDTRGALKGIERIYERWQTNRT